MDAFCSLLHPCEVLHILVRHASRACAFACMRGFASCRAHWHSRVATARRSASPEITGTHTHTDMPSNTSTHTQQASTDTLHALAGVMEAPEFGHKFLLRLRQELQQAYMAVAGTCSHYSIPVITPQAGLYALLNLRAFLEAPGGFAEEEALWRDILAKTKVNLTPGRAMHCPEPGWFRLCFASQPPPALAAALRRLDDYFSTRSHEPRPRP